MAENETKLYMKLQMDELKAKLESEKDTKKESLERKKQEQNEKNAEIAKMYEDAAEYEADLKGFEDELVIVKANELENIAEALSSNFPQEERDYFQELKTIVESGWKHYVEVEKSHPAQQLQFIETRNFNDIIEGFEKKFTDYHGDFKNEVREMIVARWDRLISIKKEHIKEELAEIKTTGLKTHFVKRIYEEYHGLR